MEVTSIYHRPDSEYAYMYDADVMHIRLKTKKDDIAQVILHYGDSVVFFEDSYQYSESMNKVISDTYFDFWELAVSVDYSRIQYVFEVIDQIGERVLLGDRGVLPFNHETYNNFMNGFKLPYFHNIDRAKVPEWVGNTVWYQIFPERFANGNSELSPPNVRPWDYDLEPENFDFFGGDLKGVLDKLDYLQDLGITGIYFCPIFEAPSNHKYDTLDYFEIDKHFGDKMLFHKLVEEAHKRGMKVMLDAVFNHIGSGSPQWQDIVKNGENSKYKDWFHIQKFPVTTDHLINNRDLTYHAFAFQGGMPKLNTANPEVRDYLLSIATYWIKHFDIDAWRLDVANEIDHHFWRAFRQSVLEVKPDLYILGEIWHSSQPWLQGDEFHAVMNYPLSESIKNYFLKKTIDTQQFLSELSSQSMYYKRQVSEVMFNLLDSHDTERIMTTAKGNVNSVQSALAFLFLQRGTPCIYYGTEVGMIGGPDPDCRRVMPWHIAEERNDFYQFVKKLIGIRKSYNTLIQKGLMQLSEVKQDVICLSFQDKNQCLQLYYNKSDDNFMLNDTKGKVLYSNQVNSEGLKINPDKVGIILTVLS